MIHEWLTHDIAQVLLNLKNFKNNKREENTFVRQLSDNTFEVIWSHYYYSQQFFVEDEKVKGKAIVPNNCALTTQGLPPSEAEVWFSGDTARQWAMQLT